MSDLLVSVPGRTLRDAVEAMGPLPDVEFIEWDLNAPAPRDRFDIVVPPYMDALGRLGALASVQTRLVQSQSIGYDGVEDALPAGVVYANAASVHEASTAELTVGLILAAQRGIPDFVRAADRGQWQPSRRPSLADRSVLLVGVGGVGRAIADRLAPFEVLLTRVARHARDDDRGHVHGIDELPRLLPEAEIVVIAVPLSEQTTGLVDAAFLAALPDGALVVNIARGAVLDTPALLAELQSGRLRAALDVTDPEPLPDGHPLFTAPGVLISPHVGGATTAMMPRMARLLRDQIERMLRGKPPRNVVLRT
ncbi:2-hydroxyacid dehydrogenase [Rathayibacter sp. YIM 133350]|uniref:2-hydroxyacid dehydrogenase n=1 Tax=Rathayibacter sp. YIM 133350 TaxID=3131992 RepID=UPI00307DDEB9